MQALFYTQSDPGGERSHGYNTSAVEKIGLIFCIGSSINRMHVKKPTNISKGTKCNPHGLLKAEYYKLKMKIMFIFPQQMRHILGRQCTVWNRMGLRGRSVLCDAGRKMRFVGQSVFPQYCWFSCCAMFCTAIPRRRPPWLSCISHWRCAHVP